MEIINNDLCKLRITDLFVPIAEWFEQEEHEEILELNTIPIAEAEKKAYNKQLALSQRKEIFQYTNSLDYDFPNKDLMLIILVELYLYLSDKPNYNINQWNLVRSFKTFIA